MALARAIEYLKAHGHPDVMSYTPLKISCWYEEAQRNRRRELREQFLMARTAAHGDRKACERLMKNLDGKA